MKRLDLVVRILYGLLFLIFGAGKFFPFAPPPPVSGEAAYFIGALILNGFIWSAVGAVEIVSALLLITGYGTRLAIVMLAPIVIVILHYLLFLTDNGTPSHVMAGIHLLSMGYLILRNWNEFLFLLKTPSKEGGVSHG